MEKLEKLEQYLRDQVEIDVLWEYDNKIIIDEELGKQLTKEGKKRFKKKRWKVISFSDVSEV